MASIDGRGLQLGFWCPCARTGPERLGLGEQGERQGLRAGLGTSVTVVEVSLKDTQSCMQCEGTIVCTQTTAWRSKQQSEARRVKS